MRHRPVVWVPAMAMLCAGGCASLRPVQSTAGLDHIAIGVPDLQAAMVQFAAQTGVQPRYGGEHPKVGTENALVDLGGGTYLELLGPKAGGVDTPRSRSVRALSKPQVAFWVVRVPDAAAATQRLRDAGLKPQAPQAGMRNAPDGSTMRWNAMALDDALQTEFFFIEWSKDMVHPATSSPRGCRLVSFRATTPQAGTVQRALRAVGARIDIADGPAEGYAMTIDCNGKRIDYR